ncbi:MAG: hypothetical protein ABI120_07770 [Gemmatimonadaceae bacterium]
MTDPKTLNAERRNLEWEMMLQYEDGSLPASEWNESTLASVAGWYAKQLSKDRAVARYEQHYHRNRHRLTHRLDDSLVNMPQIEALDVVWELVLARVLPQDS